MSTLENVVFAYLVVAPLAGVAWYLAHWGLLIALRLLSARRVTS